MKSQKNLKKQHPEFDSFHLEIDGQEFCLVGEGEYPRHSVLAGQYRRMRLEFFSSQEEAERTTGLKVEGNFYPAHQTELPLCPPEWFDPADAGEAWGEDDY